ncbi:hypothetical protein CK203_034488 [Vitis vinifera]|uniref:Uncharacterized protein n=1 Tax=Vitis vinifera TaxID=29760 RepID=A0A438HZF0_VITVI|nr:hypothetical protein CK203_034488 [Vitis vinifera]
MGCAQVDPHKGSAGIGHPITIPQFPLVLGLARLVGRRQMGGLMGSWSAPLRDRLSGLGLSILLLLVLGGWDDGRSSWGSDVGGIDMDPLRMIMADGREAEVLGSPGMVFGTVGKEAEKVVGWDITEERNEGASSVGSPVAWLDSADASGCRRRALKERSCSCSKE